MQSSRKWILGVLLALTMWVAAGWVSVVQAAPISLTDSLGINLLTPKKSKTNDSEPNDDANLPSSRSFTDNGGSGVNGTCNWTVANGVLTIGAGKLDDNYNPNVDYASPSPWATYASQITKVVFDGKVTTGSYPRGLFNNFSNLVSVEGANNLDLSNALDISFMFFRCSSLTSVDVSNWNTSKVFGMSNVFSYCSSLQNLDTTNWDTSNVNTMNFLFYKCSSIQDFKVGKWNVGKLKSMQTIFANTNTATLDVANWNIKSAVSLSTAFSNCYNLKTLDLSNWDLSNATNIMAMFSYDNSLTSLNFGNWDTHNVQIMRWLFQGCTSLTNIDISSFDMNNTTDIVGMFDGDNNLQKITLGSNNYIDGSSLSPVNTSLGLGSYWRAVNAANGGTLDHPKGNKAYTSNTLMAAFPKGSLISHAASLDDTYVLYDDKGGITAHNSRLVVDDPAWQPMDNIDSITDSEGKPVTDLSNVSVQIKDANGNSVSTVDTSTAGSYTVTYVYTDEVGIVHYVNGSSSASSVTVTVDPLIALNFIPTSWDFGQHPKGPSVLGLDKVNGGENVKDNQLRLIANGSAWQVNVKYDEFTADKTADYAGDQLKNTSLRFANVELDDAKGNNVGGVNNDPNTGDVRIAGGNDYANVVNMANVPADEKGNFTLQLGKQLSDTTLSVPELPNTNTAKDAPDYTQYHSTIYWQLVNSVR